MHETKPSTVPLQRELLLVQTLVELADTLVADFDVVELLTLLTDRCVELLGVDAAGLMLVAPEGDLRVMASSSEAMRLLELFELQAKEGPCLDCFTTGKPVGNSDIGALGSKWPRFAAEATAAGFRSVQALPLRPRDSPSARGSGAPIHAPRWRWVSRGRPRAALPSPALPLTRLRALRRRA